MEAKRGVLRVLLAAKREAPRVSKPYGTTLFGGRKKIEEEEEDLKRRLSVSSSI